jgi:hypothetical protein
MSLNFTNDEDENCTGNPEYERLDGRCQHTKWLGTQLECCAGWGKYHPDGGDWYAGEHHRFCEPSFKPENLDGRSSKCESELQRHCQGDQEMYQPECISFVMDMLDSVTEIREDEALDRLEDICKPDRWLTDEDVDSQADMDKFMVILPAGSGTNSIILTLLEGVKEIPLSNNEKALCEFLYNWDIIEGNPIDAVLLGWSGLDVGYRKYCKQLGEAKNADCIFVQSAVGVPTLYTYDWPTEHELIKRGTYASYNNPKSLKYQNVIEHLHPDKLDELLEKFTGMPPLEFLKLFTYGGGPWSKLYSSYREPVKIEMRSIYEKYKRETKMWFVRPPAALRDQCDMGLYLQHPEIFTDLITERLVEEETEGADFLNGDLYDWCTDLSDWGGASDKKKKINRMCDPFIKRQCDKPEYAAEPICSCFHSEDEVGIANYEDQYGDYENLQDFGQISPICTLQKCQKSGWKTREMVDTVLKTCPNCLAYTKVNIKNNSNQIDVDNNKIESSCKLIIPTPTDPGEKDPKPTDPKTKDPSEKDSGTKDSGEKDPKAEGSEESGWKAGYWVLLGLGVLIVLGGVCFGVWYRFKKSRKNVNRG